MERSCGRYGRFQDGMSMTRSKNIIAIENMEGIEFDRFGSGIQSEASSNSMSLAIMNDFIVYARLLSL